MSRGKRSMMIINKEIFMTLTGEALKAEVHRTALAVRREGLVVKNLGNMSARDGDKVYITPTSIPYEVLKLEQLVTIGLDGQHLDGPLHASSERRVHQAIYKARSDVRAIVHTHSVYATAWSFLEKPLDLGTEELSYYVNGSVATAEFAPAGTDELGENAAEALTGKQAVLLAKHGVVAVGKTLEEAFNNALIVERQAHIAWLLKQSGVIP